MQLEIIRAAFAAGQFDFTEHAIERAAERNISELEIREAGVAGHHNRGVP